VPEAVQVISIAARNNLVLETGHSSPAECLLLIKEAKRLGVKHVMVTHALTNPGGPLSMAEIQEAAKMGAYIELVYSPFNDAALQKDADAIRAAGAASVVISSDLGQPANPLHPDGLLALYRGLVARGIPVAEIVQMSKVNPAKLLDLEP
jgi:imidazolonepropionase-like amidohydrolase